jgi:hypothetical protein
MAVTLKLKTEKTTPSKNDQRVLGKASKVMGRALKRRNKTYDKQHKKDIKLSKPEGSGAKEWTKRNKNSDKYIAKRERIRGRETKKIVKLRGKLD